MDHLIIPKDYHSELNLHDTQIAIKTVKDFFQNLLALRLNLSRVSAPLFVDPLSGLNDELNGVERPVSFGILEQNDKEAQVVHSLAKWKRYALGKYGFSCGEGLYTDMNAIRRDETTDNIHSIFVDQWDWEKIIRKEDRTEEYLKDTVRTVYKVLRKTEKYMSIQYDYIHEILPEEIFFITSQELEDMFPEYTPKEREFYITKTKGAVCILKIGEALCRALLADILRTGNFGCTEERYGQRLFTDGRAENRLVSFLRTGVETCYTHWPACKEHPLLLPAAPAVLVLRYREQRKTGKRPPFRPLAAYRSAGERQKLYHALRPFEPEDAG